MGPRTALRVAVAASGGRDSTALLHCTARQARALGVEVLALHVHHGLMADADRWQARVRGQCRRWDVRFASARLSGAPAAGESIEAWARRERYRALTDMALAGGCALVLLAHHRRDQAETWLLQALRGAGAAGLAAMPRDADRAGVRWVRPWLDQPREAIEAYLRRHRLKPVDDASNADPRFARSRLRQQVWPALESAFADAETALAAAARRAQEARALADEVAALDLPPICRNADGTLGPTLLIAVWRALPAARRRNALRAWLAGILPSGVPQTLLDRLDAELPGTTVGRWLVLGGELRLYRDCLTHVAVQGGGPHQAAAVGLGCASAVTILDLRQPGLVPLPLWGGCLHVTTGRAGAAPVELLQDVSVAARKGGERFRLGPSAASRSLKQQFQARGVPAWERQGPLLYTAEGRLLFVPGLGVEGGCQAQAGQSARTICWMPDAKRLPVVIPPRS